MSRRALATGIRRMDFLRGDEGYKYEWGAVDEPIQRVLVRRTDRAMSAPLPYDPCASPRWTPPAVPGSRRVRVVQVWPPAPTAAPRSICTHSSRRLDRGSLRRVDRVAVARECRPQAPARGLRRHRHRHPRRRHCHRDPCRPSLRVRADVIHNHMYRAETVGTQAAIALAEVGHRRPHVIPQSTRPGCARTRITSSCET